ncbi:hypothetical protein [Methylobacterium nigriterrae]|uniref:hypothetical protein n=1 Tax=Methylobacterium nigriterrae TaxID=3127512 RepID=UPI003013624A
MADLFASGRIVDLILGLVALEALILLALRARTRRGPAPAQLLLNLASGAALMLALRASLVGAEWPPIAGWLAISFGAHLAELALRLRAGAPLPFGRTKRIRERGTTASRPAFNARSQN